MYIKKLQLKGAHSNDLKLFVIIPSFLIEDIEKVLQFVYLYIAYVYICMYSFVSFGLMVLVYRNILVPIFFILNDYIDSYSLWVFF